MKKVLALVFCIVMVAALLSAWPVFADSGGETVYQPTPTPWCAPPKCIPLPPVPTVRPTATCIEVDGVVRCKPQTPRAAPRDCPACRVPTPPPWYEPMAGFFWPTVVYDNPPVRGNQTLKTR